MSLDTLLVHTATIHYFVDGTKDRFGSPTLEHDPDLDVTVAARFEQADSTEQLTDRTEQREDFVVFLRPLARAVTGNDELVFVDRGLTLKVNGDPTEEVNGIGDHHLELNAYRIRG
jgi:hypothetical protein